MKRSPASIPPVIRAFAALGRGLSRALEVQQRLLGEIAYAATRPEDRQAVTLAVYDSQPTYLRGGARFESGLFDWEEVAFGTPPFPSSGHVLIAGAGGGREMVVLAGRGYRVTAFEPAPSLAVGLEEAARGIAGARALRASYRDLVDAAEAGSGPLRFLRSLAVDVVLLGWRSLTHVASPDERVRILSAARAIAPRAPLCLSYLPRSSAPPAASRWQAMARRLLRGMGHPPPGPGEAFTPKAGFVAALAPDDFAALVSASGYTVSWSDPKVAVALLSPR